MQEALKKEIIMENIESLEEPYYNIIKTTGYEGLTAVLDALGHGTVYIPKKSCIFKPCLEKHVIKHGKNVNYKVLAKMFGLTEKTVRNING